MTRIFTKKHELSDFQDKALKTPLTGFMIYL